MFKRIDRKYLIGALFGYGLFCLLFGYWFIGIIVALGLGLVIYSDRKRGKL